MTILGLGRLGRAIAMWLMPFGCRLRGVDPVNDVPGVERMPLERALQAVDLVIAALSLAAQTQNVVGASAIACLPAQGRPFGEYWLRFHGG